MVPLRHRWLTLLRGDFHSRLRCARVGKRKRKVWEQSPCETNSSEQPFFLNINADVFFSYSIVRKSKQRPAPVSWQSFSKTFASHSSHKQSRDDVLLGAQFSDLQSKPPGTVLATLWGRFWFDSSRKTTYELLFINPGNDLIWKQSLDLT